MRKIEAVLAFGVVLMFIAMFFAFAIMWIHPDWNPLNISPAHWLATPEFYHPQVPVGGNPIWFWTLWAFFAFFCWGIPFVFAGAAIALIRVLPEIWQESC